MNDPIKLPPPWLYVSVWSAAAHFSLSSANWNGLRPDNTVPVYSADQVRDLLKASERVVKMTIDTGAVKDALDSLKAQIDQHVSGVVPAGVQFLFILRGECEDPATLKWCRNVSEVRFAVRDALYMIGADLSELDNEIIDANLQELLDTGSVSFEGDPGLELIRVGAKP